VGRGPWLVAAALAALSCGACGGEAVPVRVVAPAPPVATSAPKPTPPAEPETPDAPFRASRPASGPLPAFTPPAVKELAMASGVPVYFVERHDLPVLDVDVVVRGGQSALAHGEFWTGRACADLMLKGAGARDAIATADALAAAGAKLEVYASSDFARATLQVPSASAEAALAVMGDAIVRPSFRDGELALLREGWKASHQKLAADRDTIGWNLTELTLYGPAHPYGHAYIADPAELDAIKVAALRAAHRRLFARERAAVIVVGDATPATFLPRLEKALAGWQPAGVSAKVPMVAPPAAPNGARISLVDLPGAAQSLVLAAEPGIPAASPDRYAFRVMNAILGGFWMSRLNANLREGKGYSYWVNSGLWDRRGGGPFRAGGAMQGEKTGPALVELLAEIRAMREGDVTADELEGAKVFYLNRLRSGFDRVDATAESLATLFAMGRPMDEWKEHAAEIAKVTAADVRRVANATLHPATMRLLVVGDRGKLEPELAKLGLGPIALRGVRGELLAPTR
jgi:zinc protease